ncbi:hypothetical protein L218DRAFT_965963 [Marasmius fiardii PR-910]|nr:hypothetical protein L218DRAFT_965963 [Marasmius fiardii PR-910]
MDHTLNFKPVPTNWRENMRNCTLNFKYAPKDLSVDVNAIFTFAPPSNVQLGPEQNRAAWHVAQLHKGDSDTGSFQVVYNAEFGFSTVQLKNDNIIHPQVMQAMKFGQSTTLQLDGTWSKPTAIDGEPFKAENATKMDQNIAVGTVTRDSHDIGTLTPTFLFKVGEKGAAAVSFHPKLLLYANSQYQQNSLMSGNVETGLIWDVELATLPAVSNWIFTEGPQGGYQVESAD